MADLESPVDPDQCRENQQIPDQFVQEGGVDVLQHLPCRDTVQIVDSTAGVPALVDLQRPWHCRGAAVQFLVEIVADSPDRLRQNDARRDGVAECRQRYPPAAARYPRANAAERDRAPDTQAAVPDPQRTEEPRTAFAEVPPPVGDDVVQPSADQAED